MLSASGLERLRSARAALEHRANRREPFTIDQIAQRAGLSASAVARAIHGTAPVDRSTVSLIFHALDTAMLPGDLVKESERRPARATNISPSPNRTYGRQQDVQQLSALLVDARLVTLAGSAGIGKTRLASEVARAVLPAFPDGAWLVELSMFTQTNTVAASVGHAFSLTVTSGTALSAVVQFLSGKRLLLVLDNCEHVVAECAVFVDELLRKVPGVSVVCTSREALRLPAEAVYRVAHLPHPQVTSAIAPDAALHYPAVEMFADRARAVHPGFTINEQNVGAVTSICRRLDGIPLAIELAASRARSFDMNTLDRRLQKTFEDLSSGSNRLAPARHRTMLDAISWSVDLLTEDERRLLRRVSILGGSWTAETAARVCAWDTATDALIRELVNQLVDKSLVIADLGDQDVRYRLLQSTREFMASELSRHGDERDELMRKLYLHVAALAGDDRGDIGYVPAAVKGRLIDENYENIVEVLRWSVTEGSDVTGGAHIVTQVARHWIERGQLEEGAFWLERAINACGEAARLELLGDLHRARALVATYGSNFERAILACRQALFAYEKTGQQAQSAHVLSISGFAHSARGDLRRAEIELNRSREISEKVEDRRGVARAYCSLAIILGAGRSEFASAHSMLEQAIAIFRQLADSPSVARTLGVLGENCALAGDLSSALMYSERSAILYRETKNEAALGQELSYQAHYLALLGRVEDARELLLRAAPLVVAYFSALPAIALLEHAAFLAVLSGHAADAARLFGASYELEKVHQVVRLPAIVQHWESHRAAALAVLGQPAYERAWDYGRQLGFDEAVVSLMTPALRAADPEKAVL